MAVEQVRTFLILLFRPFITNEIVKQARIVALEHSRNAYEARILKMNEERGLPITTNGLNQGGHGTGHGSSVSSTTLTAPNTANTDRGHNHGDDSSDSYEEI